MSGIKCPNCHKAHSVVKDGTRGTKKRGEVQLYRCEGKAKCIDEDGRVVYKRCGRKFVDRTFRNSASRARALREFPKMIEPKERATEARQKPTLSIEGIARRCGVHRSTVHRWYAAWCERKNELKEIFLYEIKGAASHKKVFSELCAAIHWIADRAVYTPEERGILKALEEEKREKEEEWLRATERLKSLYDKTFGQILSAAFSGSEEILELLAEECAKRALSGPDSHPSVDEFDIYSLFYAKKRIRLKEGRTIKRKLLEQGFESIQRLPDGTIKLIKAVHPAVPIASDVSYQSFSERYGFTWLEGGALAVLEREQSVPPLSRLPLQSFGDYLSSLLPVLRVGIYTSLLDGPLFKGRL